MSQLGFSSGSTSGRKTRVTAEALFRGPPNPQLQRFYENAKKAREDALAAQQLRGGGIPPPMVTQPQAAPTNTGRPSMPSLAGLRQPVSAGIRPVATGGGTIEAQIAEARQLAQTALSQISSINTTSDERLKNMELQLVGLQNIATELRERLDTLHTVTEDAWYGTFWIRASVLAPVSLTDGPLPSGNIVGQLSPGDSVLLVGRMQDTPVGVCMRTRRVNPDTAEISEAWVLLRDTDNKAYLGNFACV
jgi:hypothetical protein